MANILSLTVDICSLLHRGGLGPRVSGGPAVNYVVLFAPTVRVCFTFLFPAIINVCMVVSAIISFTRVIILGVARDPRGILTGLVIRRAIRQHSGRTGVGGVTRVGSWGEVICVGSWEVNGVHIRREKHWNHHPFKTQSCEKQHVWCEDFASTTRGSLQCFQQGTYQNGNLN